MNENEKSPKRTVGRRPKLTLDEKKDIINRMFVANACDPNVLTQHGLYKRLAIFARGVSPKYQNVCDYDFYGDDIKAYISILVNDSPADDTGKNIGCAYTPLDLAKISQLAQRHRYPELIAVLRAREEYICALYNDVAKAAAQDELLRSMLAMKVEELQAKETKIAALEADVERLTKEIKSKSREITSLQNENSALRRSIHEKENEISVFSHNATMRGLGINDNLKAMVRREEAKSAAENPQRKTECKIISLVPALED